MLRYKNSGLRYDRISSRTSSGSSFIDVGMLAILDGLEHTSFFLKYWINADDICTCLQVQKHKLIHHSLFLIWILISWEDLNSQYNPLMDSTEPSLCLGLPNIPLSSLYNSSSYASLPCLSVLQCLHLFKANHSLTICKKSVMPFYQPSHQFMYIRSQHSCHTGVKHPESLSFP